MDMEEFKREVVFTPAFDKRHSDPKRDYGIHGVDLRFHLIGEHGATHFVVYTNWQLPEVTREQDARPVDRRFPHLSCHPLPADLGFHRLERSEDWQVERENCDLLGGRPCYGDGSVLMAQDLFGYPTLLVGILVFIGVLHEVLRG